jgi:Cu2+-exporting ATPase
LIKGGDVLQRLSGVGHIWLDKTGTLTRGQMQLVDWFGDPTVLPAVAAIQSQSAHPIAVAMARDIPRRISARVEQQLSLGRVEQLDGGIQAQESGRNILIGNRRFVEQRGAAIPAALDRAVSRCLAQGVSPAYVAVDESVVAVAAVGDPLRDDAKPSLDALRSLGWTVGILSGDHSAIVERVAGQLDIPREWVHAELLPEEKVTRVRHESHVSTVMVGDGVNDSGALAAASVGVAVRGGAEASLAAAPVYLSRDGLQDLVRLIRLSRATMRTIRWNFAASLGYNALAISLAAAGQITPLLAAVLMPLSSLTVVAISLIAPRGWHDQERTEG